MNKEQEIIKLRHSAAHLLAHAIAELYPTTQLTIGPATKDGFFYDVLPTQNFKEEDLPKIETKMSEIAERNLAIEHVQIPKEKARALYKDNPFKLELIDQIPGDTVGLATQGDFFDLCKGGHVTSTGKLKNFKLLGISGSYWRADRNGQSLQRISGVVFDTPKELRMYEKMREDALKYDHRKLGRELDLFSFHDEGPGFPFFHPHGKTIINTMTDYLRKKLVVADYQEISTPMMLSSELWEQSGHASHYRQNMYFCHIDEREFAVKPMNCPGSILIYKERPRSYRELPFRLAEFGLVHRHELSGVLHGLFRARSFTIDDGHIYCTPEQIEEEILKAVQMTYEVLKKFGFDTINVAVSTRPENSIGEQSQWDNATAALKNALDRAQIPYEILEGEGAFYGPKIEFHIEDSMGRSWQCGTVQVDFNLPERFNLSYVNSQGTKSRPVIIHRAIYGSFERFLAITLEHHKGKLPFWLSPVQIKILTITDDQKSYATSICHTLKSHGYRVTQDESSDPISGKIKLAQTAQVPWMLVIGQKEVENNTVTLRYRDGKQEFGISLDQLLEKAVAESK